MQPGGMPCRGGKRECRVLKPQRRPRDPHNRNIRRDRHGLPASVRTDQDSIVSYCPGRDYGRPRRPDRGTRLTSERLCQVLR